MNDNRLRTKHAAAVLNVSPRTLALWRSNGAGPAYYKVGKRIYYRIDDLEKYRDDNNLGEQRIEPRL